LVELIALCRERTGQAIGMAKQRLDGWLVVQLPFLAFWALKTGSFVL